MIWTIIIILVVLWALGFGVFRESVGSLIHILLLVAVAIFIFDLIRGRRP